jgi:hypothetical protein
VDIKKGRLNQILGVIQGRAVLYLREQSISYAEHFFIEHGLYVIQDMEDAWKALGRLHRKAGLHVFMCIPDAQELAVVVMTKPVKITARNIRQICDAASLSDMEIDEVADDEDILHEAIEDALGLKLIQRSEVPEFEDTDETDYETWSEDELDNLFEPKSEGHQDE